ncbi:hypothetical protein Trihar35433_5732 [Trichoderma harzianum]|nr:hypothetical protein Trihar35433_5732 [Trichoderma harzianum]
MDRFGACKRMQIRASKDDVRTYVRGQLDGGNLEHLPSLVKQKPRLKEEIIKGISDAVDGMFLLAKIYLDTLVDKVTITDVSEAVSQLPKQVSGSGEDKRLKVLNQAYESAWERINGQKEGFRSIATRVLAWISFAKRPLSTKELQHALAVKIGTDVFHKDAIPQVQDMVSFCAEFFDRKKSDWFPNAEAMIAETCISYLSLEEFGDSCPYQSNPFYLRRSSYGLYKYASYYWGDHARVAGRKVDESVIGFLMSGARASSAFHVMLERFPMSDRIEGEYYDFYDPWLRRHSPVSGLHLAVHFELDEAINMLLKNGCDVNGRKGLEVTPLLMAIDNGHIGIAEMLLDNGAHMGFVPGQSLIYLAVAMEPHNYSERLVQKLIARGIDDGENFSLYLLLAVQLGYEAIVKLLLDKGADINATGHFGMTPLHIAAEHGQEAIMKLLLDKGADIDATDNASWTPLHYAYYIADYYYWIADNWPEGRPQGMILSEVNAIIQILIDKGANIDARDDRGRRPLDVVW